MGKSRSEQVRVFHIAGQSGPEYVRVGKIILQKVRGGQRSMKARVGQGRFLPFLDHGY